MASFTLELPQELTLICEHLIEHELRPVIVGGYLRDALLKHTSKDIDIEVFGVQRIEVLQTLLKGFGSLNLVGKEFGVLKLTLSDLDIDFSLPRLETKVSQGHKGFKIHTLKQIDFTSAANRRDFTMNAMGYDCQRKILLDPYGGQNDLNSGNLRCVNPKSFIEDPLRILRAIQFSARFNLEPDSTLKDLIRHMHSEHALNFLASERIIIELEKLLLKSNTPSKGFILMKSLGLLSFFTPLDTLSKREFSETIYSIDNLAQATRISQKERHTLALTLLTHCLESINETQLLKKFTHQKQHLKEVPHLNKALKEAKNVIVNVTTIRHLSTKSPIKQLVILLHALGEIQHAIALESLAKKIGVLEHAPKPFLLGRHLIEAGYSPSERFSSILKEAYKLQLDGMLTNEKEALIWLKTIKK